MVFWPPACNLTVSAPYNTPSYGLIMAPVAPAVVLPGDPVIVSVAPIDVLF